MGVFVLIILVLACLAAPARGGHQSSGVVKLHTVPGAPNPFVSKRKDNVR